MLATHAQPMPATAQTAHTLTALLSRLLAVAIVVTDRLAQALCGLGGHSLAFRFEPTRMSLHCLNCGHNTPGWAIDRRR